MVRRDDWVIVLVAALMVSAAVGLTVLAIYVTGPTAPPTQVEGRLVVHGWVGNLPSHFWAVSAHTAHPNGLTTDPAVQQLLNSSPLRTLRYGDGSDACDPITNSFYPGNGSVGTSCPFNVGALKAYCTSVNPECSTLYQLPAEINDSGIDAQIVAWLLTHVGYRPAYFAFGNEPSLWTHYGIPWSQWRSSDNSTPTPLAYAVDVRNGIAAVRAVDPAAQFVGIEAAGPHAGQWFTTLMEVVGPEIAAVAYHLYPAMPGPYEPTVEQLYSELEGPNNISETYADVQGAVEAGCGCPGVPVEIGEYNSGPTAAQTGVYPPLVSQYPDAVFIAASIDQALEAGLPELTLFTLQSHTPQFQFGMLNSLDQITPVGQLYESILPYFAGRSVANVTISGGGNAWAAALVTNGTGSYRVSLLVANPQVSTELILNTSAVFPNGTSALTIDWSPGAPVPSVDRTASLGPTIAIPPQGLLLVNATVTNGSLTGPLHGASGEVRGAGSETSRAPPQPPSGPPSAVPRARTARP